MSFDDKPTYELIGIAKAGLGFTINAENKPVDDLIRIAEAAHHNGATITFINPSVLTDKDRKLIKSVGKSNINFV